MNIRRALKFQECLDACGMIDMGFRGAKYTWSNLRYIIDLIQERLDKSFCNAAWRLLYPEAIVKHLVKVNSNHCPILIELEKSIALNLPRPFRFQPIWLSHPDFSDVVRGAWSNIESLNNAITSFTNLAKVWNKEVFGNIFARKRNIEARFRGIQVANGTNPSQVLIDLEKFLRRDYVELQRIEKEYWVMELRIEWMVQGDRNTTFYHTSTISRRKRNQINALVDSNRVWLKNPGDLVGHVREGFMSLFTSNMEMGFRKPWSISNWPLKISNEEAVSISCPI